MYTPRKLIGENVICPMCNKVFYLAPWKKKKGGIYCSRKCYFIVRWAKENEFSLKNGEKICQKCLKKQGEDSFYKNPKMKDGLQAKCKDCFKRWHIARTYKLHDTKAMEKRENGVCAICGRSSNEIKLFIDHSHIDGKVRGILCANCNPALGHFFDSIDLLQKAILYLKNPSGVL